MALPHSGSLSIASSEGAPAIQVLAGWLIRKLIFIGHICLSFLTMITYDNIIIHVILCEH